MNAGGPASAILFVATSRALIRGGRTENAVRF
jgi:hypothetical protein